MFMDWFHSLSYCWLVLSGIFLKKSPINLHWRTWDLHGGIFRTRKQLCSPSNHLRNRARNCPPTHLLIQCEKIYKSSYKSSGMWLFFISTEAVLALDGGRLFPAHPWETCKTPPPVCSGAWEAALMCLNIPFEEITLAEFSRCCIVAPLHII